ncbi:MAG: hypothetical protein Q7U47_04365, partial [Paludibacter sp.]|nr:hypothetical protein [Paludibacter sp.]
MNWKLVLIIIFTLSTISCQNTKNMKEKTLSDKEISMMIPSAPAVIYKTMKDYSDYVPVIMNEDRTKIISYPDPIDLIFEGKLAKPTTLNKGYLLDNRGINENVVFLKFTYEYYNKLTSPPSLRDMMSNILEKYPLTEMYSCGLRN